MRTLRSVLAASVTSLGVVASVATSQLETGVGDSTSAEPFEIAVGAAVEYALSVDVKTSAPLSEAEDGRTLRVTVHLFGEDPAEAAPDGQVVRATLTSAEGGDPLVDEEVAAEDGEKDFVVPFAAGCVEATCALQEAYVLVVTRVDETEGVARGRVTASVHAAYADSVEEPPSDDAIDLTIAPR